MALVEDEILEQAAPEHIVHYSASQLEKFKRCNIKWWWEYVQKFKPPRTMSQNGGVEIHKELETYVKEGTAPIGARASEALRHLRRLSSREHLIAESNFRRPLHLPNRVFVGQIDLVDPPKRKIRDFKSTSDIKKWGKTDYQLQEDLQLNTYAWEGFSSFWPDAKSVEVSHIYIQTKGSVKSEEVPVTITKDDAHDRWKSYLRIVDDMEEARQVTRPEDVSHNDTACNDYGGCPHRARCSALLFSDTQVDAANVFNLTSERRWWEADQVLVPPDTTRRPEGAPPATPLTVEHDSLPDAVRKDQYPMNPAEKLAALARGKGTQVETAPLNKTQSLAQKLAQQQAAPPPPAVDDDEVISEDGAGDETAPPEAPSVEPSAPPPGHVWVFEPGTKKIIGCVPAQAAPAQAVPPPATRAKTEQQAESAPAAADATKPRRGRPPSDKTKAVKAAEAAQAAETPAPPQAEAPQEAAPTGGSQIDFLFLDCFPVIGFPVGAMRFATWIAPALEKVKTRSGADWRFHDFRKGAGLLLEAVRELEAPTALVVDTCSPEARELMNHLIARASMVIQGAGR